MKKFAANQISGLLDFKLTLFCLAISLGCSSKKAFDDIPPSNSQSSSAYSGTIVVTSIATDPATGSGLVTMFNSDGSFHSSLRDLFPNLEWAAGSAFQSPDKILLLIANSGRIEKLDLSTGANTNFTTTRINGSPNRALVRDTTDGTVYLAEQYTNNIEKYDASGVPAAAPFIGATTGACILTNPSSMALISNTRRLAVIQSNRLNIYENNGSCVTSVTAAPFNANTPYAIAYHSITDKLLVAFAGNSTIYACDTLGASCSQIFYSPTIIVTPRAIAVDSYGYIYVGSSGTDTVEKLSWNGTGSAVRATTSPFLGPGIYTQNPTSIMVVP